MLLYIADDSRDFRAFVRRCGQKASWTVVEAGDGHELLERLRESDAPCLVLIDIEMPKMDGIQAIEELPLLDRRMRIRFITGGPDVNALAARMIANARDLEVGRFIQKPVSLAELQFLLEEEQRCLYGSEAPKVG